VWPWLTPAAVLLAASLLPAWLAPVLADWQGSAAWSNLPDLLLRGLDSLAWLAGVVLIVRGLDALVWRRLVPHTLGVQLPPLLRQFIAVVLLVFGTAAMLNQAWGVSIATVLATTGVLGLVLGLALRPILTDLFCGIALNVEQPFRLDDFVVLRSRGQREPIVGIVREVNWRSTRVLTPEDNLIAVPNSVAAAAIVENLSFPSPVSEQEVDILLDWDVPPPLIEAVLGAAVTEAWAQGATAGDRPPKLRMCRLDGNGVTYRIVYLLDPRRRPKGPARHLLLSCVQRHLLWARLRPVVPAVAGQPPLATPPPPVDHALVADRDHGLARVPMFALLDDAERRRLAEALNVRPVAAGDPIVVAGEPGRSMFVVAAGVVEVRAPATEPGGEAQRIEVLGPGAIFGEMSLLTGDARSASVAALTDVVLYEADGDAFGPLLTARPALAEALSHLMALHQQRDAARGQVMAADTGKSARAGLAGQLAARIRRFFRLGGEAPGRH